MFRPPVDLKATAGVEHKLNGKPHLVLNWLTPHSKWAYTVPSTIIYVC